MTPREILRTIVLDDSKIIQENSNNFDNKIIYFAAGSIAVLLVFMKDIDAEPDTLLLKYEKIFLFLGLLFLTISCFMNVYSYIKMNKILKRDKLLFIKLYELLEIKESRKKICDILNIEELSTKNYENSILELEKEFPIFKNKIPAILSYNEIDFRRFVNKRLDGRLEFCDNYNKWSTRILGCGLILTVVFFFIKLFGPLKPIHSFLTLFDGLFH